MRFFNHLLNRQIPETFCKIQGYDDVKEIVKRALKSQDNFYRKSVLWQDTLPRGDIGYL